jgi:hypothetical protein
MLSYHHRRHSHHQPVIDHYYYHHYYHFTKRGLVSFLCNFVIVSRFAFLPFCFGIKGCYLLIVYLLIRGFFLSFISFLRFPLSLSLNTSKIVPVQLFCSVQSSVFSFLGCISLPVSANSLVVRYRLCHTDYYSIVVRCFFLSLVAFEFAAKGHRVLLLHLYLVLYALGVMGTGYRQ